MLLFRAGCLSGEVPEKGEVGQTLGSPGPMRRRDDGGSVALRFSPTRIDGGIPQDGTSWPEASVVNATIHIPSSVRVDVLESHGKLMFQMDEPVLLFVRNRTQ